jgi:hypothetical protein
MTFQIHRWASIEDYSVRVQLLDETNNVIIQGSDCDKIEQQIAAFLKGVEFAGLQYRLVDYEGIERNNDEFVFKI